jgi:hypothetical protein
MTIANPPKALILLVALLSLVLLMAIGKVNTDSGMPILDSHCVLRHRQRRSSKKRQPITTNNRQQK